jgi:hypothetical protein
MRTRWPHFSPTSHAPELFAAAAPTWSTSVTVDSKERTTTRRPEHPNTLQPPYSVRVRGSWNAIRILSKTDPPNNPALVIPEDEDLEVIRI